MVVELEERGLGRRGPGPAAARRLAGHCCGPLVAHLRLPHQRTPNVTRGSGPVRCPPSMSVGRGTAPRGPHAAITGAASSPPRRAIAAVGEADAVVAAAAPPPSPLTHRLFLPPRPARPRDRGWGNGVGRREAGEGEGEGGGTFSIERELQKHKTPFHFAPSTRTWAASLVQAILRAVNFSTRPRPPGITVRTSQGLGIASSPHCCSCGGCPPPGPRRRSRPCWR